MKVDYLSVFFPAYNEEANIETTVTKANEVLRKLPLKDYEIIVVNDGSKDKTGEIVESLKKSNPHIKLISHNPNQGYGAALKSGFYNAQYPWIAFTDSDGQFDFTEITKLLEKTDQAQVVAGYRLNRQDNFIRKMNGFAWTVLNNMLFGINIRDVDCAFKLVNKEVMEKIPRLESSRGGMISPELLAKAKKSGFNITEVGVHHFPRTAGQQTGANIKVIIKSFIDLFKLWWKLR